MEGLTSFEKKNLEDFIISISKPTLINPFVYSTIISLAGLILFISAVVITLNNFVDRTVYWILLPGMISGIVLILFGMFIFNIGRKYEKTKRVVKTLKKIMTLI
jgi:uncharacterized membrane protein